MKKMRIKIFNIPRNELKIDDKKSEEVYLYGKRILKIGKNEEINEKENWFFYDIENVTYMFEFENKKWYEKIFRLTQDCDWPKLIKINYLQILKLYWYHKKLWIQQTEFWYKLITLLTTLALCYLTYELHHSIEFIIQNFKK